MTVTRNAFMKWKAGDLGKLDYVNLSYKNSQATFLFFKAFDSFNVENMPGMS